MTVPSLPREPEPVADEPAVGPGSPLGLRVVRVTDPLSPARGKWRAVKPDGTFVATCNTRASALRAAKEMETLHRLGARLR